jgi:L-asparaginase
MIEAMTPDPHVVLFALGGTIAMTPDADRQGAVPSLSAAQLIAAVPGLDTSGIEIEVVDFRQLPGASLSFSDLAALATAVDERLASGADGAIVTQGTDTIEESAYVLDLLLHRPEPVVVTGAMRHAALAGADGPANVLAAAQVASSPSARDRGCLVVMADEIHAARRVRKTHSASLTTFRSPDSGPVGHVVDGRPMFMGPGAERLTVPAPTTTRPPRVALLVASLGDDGGLLDAVAAGYDGLVVAGFGVGHVPRNIIGRLGALADEVPVVLASRTGAGAVHRSTYSFPGSESDAIARGLLPAGMLDPFKARVLLHLLLSAGADRATIADAVAVASGYREPAAWPWPVTTAVRGTGAAPR